MQGGAEPFPRVLFNPSKDASGFYHFLCHCHWYCIFLVMMRGPLIILFLVFGFFCAFFYTAPPIQFGYRGLGEIAQLLCFGPGIGLGAYYVQAQRLSWEAFWGTLPFGIMLFSMITINEIPDYLEDRKGKEA